MVDFAGDADYKMIGKVYSTDETQCERYGDYAIV
jgi:hypothetical protein